MRYSNASSRDRCSETFSSEASVTSCHVISGMFQNLDIHVSQFREQHSRSRRYDDNKK
jgi:hypothetical protein